MKTLLLIPGLLLTIFSFSLQSQTFMTEGRVTDTEGHSLSGVTVLVKGTKTGAITDMNGRFRVGPVRAGDILVFSFVGFLEQEISVGSDTSFINVKMKEDIMDLDEVVVVGYGVQKKSVLTGAISTITGPLRGIRKSRKRRLSTSITYDKSALPPMDIEDNNTDIHAGMLTAGEVNDFSKWNLWTDLSKNELNQYQLAWKINPSERYSVQLKTADGFPVIDAKISLMTDNGKSLWEARTDNTGKAELWNNAFDTINPVSDLKALIDYQGSTYTIGHLKKFHEGVNTLDIPVKDSVPDKVDIAFVVDATGSMSDEINYLKAELSDIMQHSKKVLPDAELRLGVVFYRDIGDAYLTRKSDFSNDIEKSVHFVQENNAYGGGDGPEAVDAGLKTTLEGLHWSDDARTRLAFLVLDAPPHQTDSVIHNMTTLTQEAAGKGVRIIPVTCSGIDKSTEYLMRSLALLTNGTYTFLTDDSGIGDPHIKPSTDKYDVESFNDLVIRLIYQYTHVPVKEQEGLVEKTDTTETDTIEVFISKADTAEPDSSKRKPNEKSALSKKQEIPATADWKIYPNPTTGPVTVESEIEMKEIFISDISGKILERHKLKNSKHFTLDLSQYPDGIYFICNEYDREKWMKGKVLLIR